MSSDRSMLKVKCFAISLIVDVCETLIQVMQNYLNIQFIQRRRGKIDNKRKRQVMQSYFNIILIQRR